MSGTGGGGLRHLISIDDLDRPGIERILDRAESFAERGEPTLVRWEDAKEAAAAGAASVEAT